MPKHRHDHKARTTAFYDWAGLMERRKITARDLATRLGISYPTMLRVINNPNETPFLYGWAAYGLDMFFWQHRPSSEYDKEQEQHAELDQTAEDEERE